MATKKMYKKGGTTSKKMGGKKQVGGVRSPRPVASFIEPPTEQPFAQDSFVAREGGVSKKQFGGSQEMKDLKKKQRETRKKARADRRADRKATRQAIRTLKKSSRLKRRDKINDAGEDISMTRRERREDRRATRKASRTFRKQERQKRRASRKELRRGQRGARQEQRGQDKRAREIATQEKLDILNKSKQPSVTKTTDTTTEKKTIKKEDSKTVPVKKKTPPVKKSKKRGLSEFEQAFADNRKAGKKEFEFKGKRYHTRTKEEEEARKKKEKEQKKKNNPVVDKKNKIDNEEDINQDNIKDKDQGITKRSDYADNKEKKEETIRYQSCFSAGTLIETSNGQIPIEMIKIDDEVKSYNTKTKEIELAKVDELFVHEDCGDGLILNGIIKTTTNHPFYVDGKWVEAGDLNLGDEILHVDGLKHKITSMETNSENQTVYNFEVPGHHNYFAEGYLVHNKQRRGGYRRRGGRR